MRKRINGEGTYYHNLKQNRWEYKISLGYDENEKPIRKTFTGATPEKAKEKAENYIASSKFNDYTIAPNILYKDWIITYIKGYKQGNVKYTWYNQLLQMAESLPKKIASKKVSDITPIMLIDYLNSLLPKYSYSFIDKMKTLLKSSFTEALENGIISTNPARKLKTPKKTTKPKNYYNINDCKIIIESASSHYNKVISIAVVTLLLTGIRRGEMLGLQWSDIIDNNLHINRAVYIDSSGRPVYEEYRAKTESSIRIIPLSNILISLFEQLPHNNYLIFPSQAGNIIEPHNFNAAYYRYIDTLSLSDRLSPHCLRHTFATLQLSSGANLKNLQLLLGHTNMNTTAGYTHPNINDLRNNIDSFSGIFYQKVDNKVDNQ